MVAEGVETLEELEFLQAHQCEEAQGYYFSRPVPPQQFATLLKSGISEQARLALRRVNKEMQIADVLEPSRAAAASR